MRILQVGKFYHPIPGGMERVLQELCEGLVAKGTTVRALVANRPSPLLNGLNAFSTEVINGVEVRRLPCIGQLFSQPLVFGFRREISNFKPDLIHFHLPNPVALLGGWTSQIPSCLTLHAEPDGIKKYVDHLLTERVRNRSAAWILSSDQMKLTLETRAPSNVHVEVIPFGFRFNYLQDATKIESEQNLTLFVGRLVAYKGLDRLIRAIARSQSRLCIVGDGPEKPRLENLVRQLNLIDRVTFAGVVRDKDLSEWYQRCSIYIQPSISTAEAFGISMLEAMHFGKPVISTDLPTGVTTVNRHGVSGLVVPPDDIDALAHAINQLITDKSLQARLGSGAREHVKDFSFEQMINRHLEVYRTIV